MAKITWHIEKRKVSDLKNWEKNPRTIGDQEMERLKEKIKERGFHDVLKIDTDGTIISGNQRKKALEELGTEDVDVIVPSKKLTERERDAVALESNITEGQWDFEGLSKNFDMETILGAGFDDTEIGQMFDDVMEISDDEFDEEKAVEEVGEPKSKPGDLYQLDSHFLLCGDSTIEADVKRLVGENKINCIYADPPYNIGLDYRKGISTSGKYDPTLIKSNTHFGGVKVNDKKSTKQYEEFIDATIKNGISVCEKDTHIFYWCDENYIWLIQELFKDNNITTKRVCLWIKNNFNMTPQVAFNKVYEPCVYGTIGNPFLNKNRVNLNEILNKEIESGTQVHDEIQEMINIWLVKRDNAQDYEHPTQKPLTLHEKPLKRCTKVGDKILDLFGGSGSTMMSCEQLKRKAFLVEFNPVFVDVIINRFEKLTGVKARLVS